MPSPVGHALGGIAFGVLLAPRRTPSDDSPHLAGGVCASGDPAPFAWSVRCGWSARLASALLNPSSILFAALGVAPDLDFLVGRHSRETHSIGAAALVFLVAALWRGRYDVRRGLVCAAAYGSHIVFDWMGTDTSVPIGIMALWPFSDGFYQSQLFVFESTVRQFARPDFWTLNAVAVSRELLLLLPLTTMILFWRYGRSRTRPAAAPVEPELRRSEP